MWFCRLPALALSNSSVIEFSAVTICHVVVCIQVSYCWLQLQLTLLELHICLVSYRLYLEEESCVLVILMFLVTLIKCV